MNDPNDISGQLGALMNRMMEAQSQMQEMEERMAERTVEGQAAGGRVRVVANGRMELVSVHIAREAFDPDDPEMLEDLILSAANQALRTAREEMAQAMAGLAGGLGLPGFP